jgi:hypothetical protein
MAAMGRTRKFGIFTLALVFSLIFEGSASAQRTEERPGQQKAPPPKVLQHEVSVTLKLIQVTVTDKAGKPVPDLRREEFLLFDNGKQQNLTEFERHDVTLPARTEPASETRVVVTPAPSSRLMI